MTGPAVLGWALAVVGLGCLHAARRARARRELLVARAVHEVRGPLAAARLALHAVAGAGGSVTTGAAAVDRELLRAARALDDLAQARTGRAAGVCRERVDVLALLGETAESWRPAAAACGARLRLDVRPPLGPVLGDRIRLSQAIGNLIANALEHGGPEIELRARRTPAGVRVEVADDGPGLPAPVSRLARRAARSRRARGHGLAIAAQIAAAHGGRVSAAPAARGARVALELPPAELGAASVA